MARVFERPRYINQAANRLIGYSTLTQDPSIIRAVSKAVAPGRPLQGVEDIDYSWIAGIALDGVMVDDFIGSLDDNVEDYILDVHIGNLVRERKMSTPKASRFVCNAFLQVFREIAPSTVHADSAAVFDIVARMMEDLDRHAEPSDSREARAAANAVLRIQSLGQKIAPGRVSQAIGASSIMNGLPVEVIRWDRWCSAMENLVYRAHPMWVKYCQLAAMGVTPRRLRVREGVEKASNAPANERFKFSALDGILEGVDKRSYNYAGVVVLYIGKSCYFLDASAVDQLRTVATSLRNAAMAFKDYRLTGDPSPPNLWAHYLHAVRRISRMIRTFPDPSYVARHMHLAYTRWQNAVGEEEAPIDCGWGERDISLKADNEACGAANSAWYDWVVGLQIPARAMAEVFKLYHLLPPPDIDQAVLHNELFSKTSDANKYNPSKWQDFITFCKAYDISRFMYKKRKVPNMAQDPGYIAQESAWAKRCLAGKFTMAPKSDWGKARISREFPYDHSGDFHIFSAKDSTRVVSRLAPYMDRAQSRSLTQVDQNELLSALFNGPILSNGESMSEWRDRVMTGNFRDSDECIAAIAGKSENTKPGKKVRETLSGCDTVREFLTEVDHALRPLADLTPGVSIRVPVVTHKRKFQSMGARVSTWPHADAIATSTDIAGWSPYMPRPGFHDWQDYALGTTQCENPRAVRGIWDRLTLFTDRRGYKRSGHLSNGNIQGWPATSDTTMHAHILIYWVHLLSEEGVISQEEKAYTLCLIDDAATVVVLGGTLDEKKQKAERARELLRDLYLGLGFKMDTIKSFFSSVKFVYLNELYLDGAQVAHSTKTMMRIDRDHARRFAGVADHVATLLGTAASAAATGGDPLVAYWMACWMGFRLAYRACPKFAELSPWSQAIAGMAPASMRGLGIRPICAVMSSGALDQLSWYAEIADACRVDALAPYWGAILGQTPSTATAKTAAKSPFGYSVEGWSDPSGRIRRIFRKAAQQRGLAEPFSTLSEIDEDPSWEEAITATLGSGCHEASLLEETFSNMPDSFVDEALARVDKSEVVAVLLGSRGIGAARRAVQAADRLNLEAMVHIVRYALPNAADEYFRLRRLGSFEWAKSQRSKHLGDYCILNHTYPCPYSMWAFHGLINLEDEANPKVSSSSYDDRRLHMTLGSGSRNLYDSRLAHIGYKAYRSVGASVVSEARIQLYNPVRRKIAAGLAALRWAQNSGHHHLALTSLFMQAWAGRTDTEILDVDGRLVQGSTKRISLRHSRTNHLIFPFPNTQGAVKVDVRSASAYHTLLGDHHMHDMMGAITALRLSGLIEASLGMRFGMGGFAYGFGYKVTGTALVDRAIRYESPAPYSEITKVTAFTSIESSLSDHVKVCTSAGAMQRVMNLYMEAGAAAAERLYRDLSEGDEADVAPYIEGTRVSLAVASSTMDPTELHAAHAIILGDVTGRAGVGDPYEHVAPRTRESTSAAVLTAALTPEESARAIGSATVDEKAVALALDHAVAAAALDAASRKDDLPAFMESDDYEKNWRALALSGIEIDRLVEALRSSAAGTDMELAIRNALYSMGMPGWRRADELHDASQSISSFVGTTVSSLGWLRELARSLRKLRAREAYSSIVVAGGAGETAAVARVKKAQWSFASGRHAYRADQAAARKETGPATTRNNYMSVFARAAARSVSFYGRFSNSEFFSGCYNATVRSLLRHMIPTDDRAAAENLLGDRLAFDDLMDVDDCLDEIRQTCGQLGTPAADLAIIEAALGEVNGWVVDDLAAAHASIRLASRRLRTRVPAAPVESVLIAPTTADFRTFVIPQITSAEVGDPDEGN